MKFGDFLFPESRTPETDYDVVNEALAEAERNRNTDSEG